MHRGVSAATWTFTDDFNTLFENYIFRDVKGLTCTSFIYIYIFVLHSNTAFSVRCLT